MLIFLSIFFRYNLTVDRTAAERTCMTVTRQRYEFGQHPYEFASNTCTFVHVLSFSSERRSAAKRICVAVV